jgi:hypothetical protein
MTGFVVAVVVLAALPFLALVLLGVAAYAEARWPDEDNPLHRAAVRVKRLVLGDRADAASRPCSDDRWPA